MKASFPVALSVNGCVGPTWPHSHLCARTVPSEPGRPLSASRRSQLLTLDGTTTKVRGASPWDWITALGSTGGASVPWSTCKLRWEAQSGPASQLQLLLVPPPGCPTRGSFGRAGGESQPHPLSFIFLSLLILLRKNLLFKREGNRVRPK